MNRRDFFGWLSRLLAVLPFVALADLMPKSESESELSELTEWWGPSIMAETLDLWQKNQALALRVMPWELEAPREEVERLSEILAEADSRLTPWWLLED